MRELKTSAVLAAALLGIFGSSAHAQETVVAKVPFPFVLRGQEFGAGRYSINTEQGMIMIRGIDNSGGAFALAVSAGGDDPIGDQPALVFVRYENGYRLSQVWPSSTEGLTIQDPSVVEHHASAASAASIVAIAARYK
jgi:hypothetical protein